MERHFFQTIEEKHLAYRGRGVDASTGMGTYRWYVIGLLTVVSVFSYMDRMALAVLAPRIKSDLALSDAQLGLLTGFAFSLFYAVCGLPIARLADRGIRRNIIAIAITVWSVMTAISGAAQNFWHLFAARVGIGAGESGALPTAQSLLCDYVTPSRRPGAFAIVLFGNHAGMMIGFLVAGLLGEVMGWRWTFVALGAPGLLLAIIVRMTLREPVRGRFDEKVRVDEGDSVKEAIAILWRCRTYRWLGLLYVLYGFVQAGLMQWWPTFYMRVHDMSVQSVGASLGLAIGIGSGIGGLAGGLVSNRIVRFDVKYPLRFSAAMTTLAFPAVLGSTLVSSSSLSILLVAATCLLWSVANGAVVATIANVVSPRMRATASSVAVFCQSVLGFGLGPFCVGALSDSLSQSWGSEALRYALLAPIAALPFAVWALWSASTTVPADLRGRELDIAQSCAATATEHVVRVDPA